MMVARTTRRSGSALAALTLVLVLVSCGEQPVDNGQLAAAAREGRPVEVTVQGRVLGAAGSIAVTGTHHEQFRLDAGGGLIVEVDHNLDLAPAVPLRGGETVTVHGQFEPDPGHPVIHYTHHATGRHEGGWIDLGGHRYQ